MERSRFPIALRLLLLWGAFIVYGTTIPFDLVPSADVVADAWARAHKTPWVEPGGGRPSLTDAVTNVLLFIPWGFLLGVHLVGRRRGLARVLLVAGVTSLLLSAFVETLQLFASARTTSATDLVNNGAGGVLGGFAGWLAGGRIRATLEPRLREGLRTQPWSVLSLLVALAVMLWSVSPFDLSLDVDDLKRAVKTTRIVPFGPALRANLPTPGVQEYLPALFAWTLVGGVFAMALRRRGPRGIPYWTTSVVAVAGLAILSEGSQLIVRGRVTDATTVLFATLGGAIGAALVHAYRNRPARDLAVPAIAIWAAAVLAAGLDPWHFGAPGPGTFHPQRFLPFIFYFRNTNVYALADASLQILTYMPLGALLRARDARCSLWQGALAGALAGLVVEASQVFLPRVADLTDVCLGAAGAALGVWIWRRGVAGG